MSQVLHLKYRPTAFDEVIGQDAVVNNLAQLFKSERIPHSFLFSGPAGTGKTTLGRIIGSMLDVKEFCFQEVDGARFSGIEQVRALVKDTAYIGLSGSKRVVMIDECHRITKQGWDALLKETEEPPEHLFWVFCTTDPEKIPQTIRTRMHAYDLKPVRWDVLAEYLALVREQEKLKVKPEFVDLAARRAEGSVRQALVNLSLLDGITEREEALRLVEDAEASGPGIEFAKMIVSGQGFGKWENVTKALEALSDVSPETIRQSVIGYASGALMRTKGDKEAQRLLAILHTFSTAPGEKMVPLLLASGSLLFN